MTYVKGNINVKGYYALGNFHVFKFSNVNISGGYFISLLKNA